MSERGPAKRPRWARLRSWILPAVAFGLAVIAVLVLFGKLRREIWAYYSDGAALQAEVDDDKARPVLWQDPEPHHFQAGKDPASEALEAAFSADGTMMVLVRRNDAGGHADLYRSDWDGRVWSRPEPIGSINTKASERSPALSRDGRYLYFASDRKEGRGGYDLYVARWDGTTWRGVKALPDTVNTAAGELGPALSADDSQLYFSSDRDTGDAEDIFVSEITVPEVKSEPVQKKEQRNKGRKKRKGAADLARSTDGTVIPLAPVPKFGVAQPMDDLNSKAADVRAALTTRGDHVFLASDRDRGRRSGFKIYFSRVVGGEAQPPEEVDLYIEEGDVTDPAVRMEGFDLLFSVGADSNEAGGDSRLFRSTTREVVGYTDRSRWEQFKELMGDIKWWLLLAIAALIALIYILERWRDMTSLFHKCLAGSAVLHLLALLLAMVLLIATTIENEESRKMEEVEVSIDALAQEELAMESIPEETALTDTTTNLESEKVESEFGAPGFEAPDESRPVPDAAPSAKESVLVEAQPSMSEAVEEAVTKPSEEASLLNDLTATLLPEIEAPKLEERDPSEPQPASDPAAEQFEPAQPMAETEKVEPQMTEDNAVETPPDATQVTEHRPVEPLVDQPKEPEFVESTATESTPTEVDVPAETPPLESDLLAGLPDAQFVDPNEAALEELNPANAGAGDGPADPAKEMFDPGQAASNLATEQSESGGTAADSADSSQSGAADVAESALDSGSAAGSAVVPELADATSDDGLPSSNMEAALPESSIIDPGAPMLEEPGAQADGMPADESKDQFDPGAAASNLATAPVEGSVADDSAVPTEGDASEIPAGGMVPTSAVAEARPTEVAQSTPSSVGTPSLDPSALPETGLVDLDAPTLEEGGNRAGPPADPSREMFEPGQAAANLATTPSEGQVASDSAVATPSDPAAVSGGGMVADSAVNEAPRSESATTDSSRDLPPSTPGALPAVAVVELGVPLLEEPGGGGAPADVEKDKFEAGNAVPNLATSQAGGGAVGDVAVVRSADAGAIEGAVRDTAGGAPMSHDLAATGAVPDLDGGGVSTDLTSPGLLPSPGLPAKLEVPDGLGPRGMADIIKKQRGKPGIDTIEQMGGSKGSEESVGAAMEWLSKNQEADGRWDTVKHGAKQNFDTGGTGLALLCYLGWGERHDVECKYRKNVGSALDWLVAQQRKDGYLGGGPGMMYSHAIAAIALCEAYGVTRDPKLKGPAERAIAYTLAAQHPTLGGWRYTPGNGADTSVTGWQYMALHSARMAGLDVPEAAFEKTRGFLTKMGGGKHGGLYGYQTRSDLSRAMVATGMFCRQLDLVPPSDPMMLESARVLKMHPMKTSSPDLYYVYYATLALYQHQGPVWTKWNERLQESLQVIQKKNGAAAGSWDPSSSMTGDGGRVISTTLATLSLEVYYRLLPMYGFRNTEAEAPEKKVRGE